MHRLLHGVAAPFHQLRTFARRCVLSFAVPGQMRPTTTESGLHSHRGLVLAEDAGHPVQLERCDHGGERYHLRHTVD